MVHETWADLGVGILWRAEPAKSRELAPDVLMKLLLPNQLSRKITRIFVSIKVSISIMFAPPPLILKKNYTTIVLIWSRYIMDQCNICSTFCSHHPTDVPVLHSIDHALGPLHLHCTLTMTLWIMTTPFPFCCGQWVASFTICIFWWSLGLQTKFSEFCRPLL